MPQNEPMHDHWETLLYDERDGVAVVTLNRPEVHNAFNTQMQRELRSLWAAQHFVPRRASGKVRPG